jgi:cytochrome c-type biogenesis protein CcmE
VARNPRSVRLILALSVAGVLAVFLLYVSLAGGRTVQVKPSELPRHKGNVSLVGKVVGPVHGAGYSRPGLRFGVADIGAQHATSVPVVYRGSVPDLFKVGRDVVVDGTYQQGVFVAKRNTLVTKCPSKYSPKKTT